MTTSDRSGSHGGPDRRAAGRSRWVDIGGPVHYLDYGGPADGPVVVAVHGLGGSAVNWSAIAPLLTGRCRVFAPDLAGHGRTESLGRSTTVAANRILLHRFIEAVPGSPVILMGNSMGGMLSMLEAAAAPDAVAGLVLVNAAYPFGPALPHPFVTAMFAVFATPVVGRFVMGRRRAAPPDKQVAALLRLCCVDPSRVPADVVADHVELARHRAGLVGIEHDLLHAARSVVTTAGLAVGRAARRGARAAAGGAAGNGGRDPRMARRVRPVRRRGGHPFRDETEVRPGVRPIFPNPDLPVVPGYENRGRGHPSAPVAAPRSRSLSWTDPGGRGRGT